MCDCELAAALSDLNETKVELSGTCKYDNENELQQLSSFVKIGECGKYGVF